ncbi:LOW QUALITY PROTEIN: rho GTPase-activating protein 45-like [Conger conger]|uniref:LOW QUALITY PROTEIN: rho GTPase-activating protein 45-like n=1 Tax=Conger conger TaxID=82655 RepID=UPI002A59DBDB|nr:LOW QUALITY PROTEIN: rho GTPase-activating protein 45-like [Conger conger]
MFSRKRKELIKTPSISKRSPTVGPHNSTEQPRRDGLDSDPSCVAPPAAGLLEPGSSPCPLQGRLTGCPSPGATLRRPTGLSRHASAAGAWGFSKARGAAASYSPAPDGPAEGGVAIDVTDIPPLLRDVARFAEAVEKLKDVVMEEDKQEDRRRLAHESLGEVLRVLRQVINTYPLLNTVETLTAAGTLISKVKGFHYEVNNEIDKKEFEKAIETIAVAFSSNVSELLMGEVDSSTLLSLPPSEKGRASSMENLYGGVSSQGSDSTLISCDLQDCVWSAEEVDITLQRSEGGVDSALTYAKSISKYLKDVIGYVDKRIALEVEFAKGLHRLYQTSKQSIAQPHMPFFSIYCLALEQDLEQSSGVQQTSGTLYSQTFLQPLVQRRQEHEKKRKEIKDHWQRAQRKLLEAESNLRKAKQGYAARCEEYDKARGVATRAEEEQQGSTNKALDKKKRLEEEARNKAEEAEATYRTCIADASTQSQELEDVKVNVLRQLQEVIKQTDQTLRSSTISYYRIMYMQTAALPVHYQTLCESSKLYDPGQQYAAHVRQLQMPPQPEAQYSFQPYSAPSGPSLIGPRTDSFGSEAPPPATEAESVDGGVPSKEKERRGRGLHKSWPSAVSDTDSMGCGSGLDSPTASTGDVRKMQRPTSMGSMSSNDDAEEKTSSVTSFEQSMNWMEPAVPTGPFRNVGLSKAARTHRLRKLRTPAKCRECDSYVYFQGAECEECFLACHKKCLESLAIQCGHKKLQGRLQLFGRDFAQVAHGNADGVPFVVKKCIQEIERRALKMKGIYRVNGVKTRVEKLCQAFENGKELVELSQASPHDISNMLKLYLRQLPEPIMPFRMYNDLMGVAKESLRAEPGGEAGKGAELVDRGAQTDAEVLTLVQKLGELVKGLPPASVATLRYITRHLRRIAELEEDNKMSPSNLGIVFGPTLMRPRPTGATVSLSSLVDYPHQARVVEALIVFHDAIFHPGSASSPSDPASSSSDPASSSPDPASSSPDPASSSQRHSQDCSEEGGNEGQDQGDGQECQPIRTESEKGEEFCGNSLASSGSQERSLDSDWELDEAAGGGGSQGRLSRLAKQASETSTEEEQKSPRSSLELPPLPDTEPPDCQEP